MAVTRTDHTRRDPADAQRRAALLASAVEIYVDQGWNVAFSTEYEAMLERRRPLRRVETLVVHLTEGGELRAGPAQGGGRHVR